MANETNYTAANLRVILASGFQPDYVREVAYAYARQDKYVQVIGGDMHSSCAFEEGVEFVNLRGRDTKEPSHVRELLKLTVYYVRLVRFVASTPARVIYDVSIGRPFLRCVLMYSMFRLLGKQIVYTAHNVLPHDGETLVNRVIYFILYRYLANAIIVHGKSIQERLINEFNFPSDRIHVIHHGTYRPKNDPALTKFSARQNLGISQDAKVALFFGLQRPYKGTDFAIRAILKSQSPNSKPPSSNLSLKSEILRAHLYTHFSDSPLNSELSNLKSEISHMKSPSQIPNLQILIRGHASEPTYRERLLSLVNEASAHLSIDAKLESIPDADMETLFKASDIVVLPYLEGSQSGIKYMAYAYGRPVLASAVGSLGECVLAGKTGETFEVGDESAFVAQLTNMFAHLDRYSEEGIQSIAYTEFSFDAAVRRVEDISDSLSPHAIPKSAMGKEPT